MPGTPHMSAPAVAWDMGPPSDPPDIVELIVQWFFQNFEDPAKSTPWDEGEYVFIWGGPFNAHDELEYAFGSAVTEQALKEAADKIEAEGWEWALR
jgi:hypothetical protein